MENDCRSALSIAGSNVVEKLSLPRLCELLTIYKIRDEEGAKEAAERMKKIIDSSLIDAAMDYCDICRQTSTINNITSRNNLVYKNMMNVKPAYKKHKCINVYDGDFDSYCSLVAYDDFKRNFGDYIYKAYQKRTELFKYNLIKRLQP